GSRASISPPAAVLEIAPANVLHGAVRLQGLTSSPPPETQVRVACAWANEANASRKVAITTSLIVNRNLFIWSLLFFLVEVRDGHQLNADPFRSLLCRVFPWLTRNGFSLRSPHIS